MELQVISLREWAPLSDVLDKIPSRIQKGIFPAHLSITCVDVVPEFIALGTDAGIVFWYNRINGDIQKLRAETSNSISCVRIVSSVEYMIAAGSITGEVSVFQIQKEIPIDLNLVAPLTKQKPIQRYTIRDLHKSIIRSTEWSKNGMKLFSGDKNGVVVLTEFDYQTLLSKSKEILNESFEIVQLSVYQSYLLVSTLYHSIICRQDQEGKWHHCQVGKKDRKLLGDFGGTFLIHETFKLPRIVSSRPGLRLWLADSEGNVEKTLIFKDSKNLNSTWQIPLLNPSKSPEKLLKNFSSVIIYCEKLAISYDETVLCILNLEELKIEAIARGFRNIINVTVCGKEIFVLEGARSIIRLAPAPEPPSKTATIIFNPLLPPPLPQMISFQQPFEYEAAEEYILNAEECCELPPIENIELDIPIQIGIDSPTTERNRRIEILNEISKLDFDESILFQSAKKSSKNNHLHFNIEKKKNKPIANGIVEIGLAISEELTSKMNKNSTKLDNKDVEKNSEIKTESVSMDESYYNGSIIITDKQSPEQRSFMKEFEIEPVILGEISEDLLNKLRLENEKHQPYYSVPSCSSFNYPKKSITTNMDDAEVQTSPQKKLYYHCDDDYDDDDDDDDDTDLIKPINYDNQNKYVDHRNIDYDTNGSSGKLNNNITENYQCINSKKTLKFLSCRPQLDQQSLLKKEMENKSDKFDIQIAHKNLTKLSNYPDLLDFDASFDWKLIEFPESPESSESNQLNDWEFID